MIRRAGFRLLWVLLLLGLGGTATAAPWRADPRASTLEFEAYYQGQAAPGRFREFEVLLELGPGGREPERLEVTVALASFDMGSREILDAVRAPEWLDLTRFPTARFVSDDIRRQGASCVARGRLRLKGIEREVTAPFEWERGNDAGRLRGATVIDRTAFDVGTGEWASDDPIGLEIRIAYDVRLVPAQ